MSNIIRPLSPQDIFAESSTQELPLGTLGETQDGRRFRYCKVGVSALVAGNLIQGPAQVANHLSLVPSAAAVGATSLTVTLGATAATANQYAEGFAIVSTTPGNGQILKIKGHPAAALSASLTVQLEDAVQVVITASSTVDLVLNPHKGVIQNPTTPSGCVVGVASKAFTAAYFAWIQCHGVAPVLCQGGITVGLLAVAGNGTAGTVELGANASTEAYQIVGHAVTTCSDGENAAVFLTIG